MPFSARELTAAAIRYSGLPLLIRHTVALRRASIVLYHDPAPEVLDRHLAWLARRYRFVSFGRIVEAIRARDGSDLPRRALAVTIDDGHRGNARLGEVFRRHGVRPTLYVCSQIVGTSRRFWFLERDGADTPSLKRLPNAERLAVLERRTGFTPAREYPDEPPQALSRSELAAVCDWADVGSHTRTHPILTTCSEEESRAEVVGSRAEVEALTGRPCVDFCFPNGDYGEREIRACREAGYRSARTIDVGWNGPNSDPYRLRITGVTDVASLNVLAVQVSGITMYLRYLRAGSLSGRAHASARTAGGK